MGSNSWQKGCLLDFQDEVGKGGHSQGLELIAAAVMEIKASISGGGGGGFYNTAMTIM